jgi:hypothetical protein
MDTFDCSKLGMGLQAVNCGAPPIGGTGPQVILLNYSEIDRGLSVIENNVISSLILKGAAKGYKFQGLDDANVGTTTLNKGTYMSNFQQDLVLRIFAKNEDSKKFVNYFNGARVVAVVQNKENGDSGDVKWECYGWDAGLELNELTATTEMTDNVVYQLTIGSGANSKESSLPKSVFITDLTTTETMLNGLLAT